MPITLDYINSSAKNPEKFIRECTEEYHKEIRSVAERIAGDDDIKIVALAGPSASGKTTSAHILMNELESLGESIEVVSLDDFYKQREDLPVLPDGSYDIESVNSLDTKLIKKVFDDILKNGKTFLPRFDFLTKKRTDNDREIKVGEKGIVIVEGLHALNPKISGLVPKKNIFKIFVCLDKAVEDNNGEQLLSARQLRLVRRVIRDDKFRGADIKETLALWNNVLDGEIKYLFPYKDTADSKIRTMQPFEICVYKNAFCSLRSGVNRNTPWYEYFIDVVNRLEQFSSIDASLIPENSLIKEFIG